jgi:hypothetical protein
MKIRERDVYGELCKDCVDTEARIFAEKVRAGELKIADVPDEFREQVSILLI